jgi:hypothetical protein
MKPRVVYYEYGVSGFLAVLIYNDERDQEVGKGSGYRDGFVNHTDGTIVSICLSHDEIKKVGHPITRARVEQECSSLLLIAEAYVQRNMAPLIEIARGTNGDIRLYLRNRREVQEIMDKEDHQFHDQGFYDMIEHELCNGWDSIDPGINAWVGMTSCSPIITDEYPPEEEEHNPNYTFPVYAYADYWRYDIIEQILEEGFVELQQSEGRGLSLDEDVEMTLQTEEYLHINDRRAQ